MRIILIAVLMLCGCGNPAQTEHYIPPVAGLTSGIAITEPPEAPFVAKLRTEAKLRQVNYRVYCYQGFFFGVAWPYGEKLNDYIEQGGHGSWIAKAATQQGAANELRIAIRRRSGSDWYPSDHDPLVTEKRLEQEHHMICPPELSGGESQP